MKTSDFIIIGTGGGGGAIAWVLARAGYSITILEQGADWRHQFSERQSDFNDLMHDEYRFRIGRPDSKRRPRGDYNTLRKDNKDVANTEFGASLGGWTANILGGGSTLWGAWAVRCLPVDLRLKTLFTSLNQQTKLNDWGYSVEDWPIQYSELEPFLDAAEVIFSVCGDRNEINRTIKESSWFTEISTRVDLESMGSWFPTYDFPSPPYPQTPVGAFFSRAMTASRMNPTMVPTALVHPNETRFNTISRLLEVVERWPILKQSRAWGGAENLWSDTNRRACNMCGYCGEYICWGVEPKSGSISTFLKEIENLPNVSIITDAKAFEITYDSRLKRATGVRYIDTSDYSNSKVNLEKAKCVIVAAGAIQSARLLLLSGPPGGIGNRFGNIGKFATFHTFGLGASILLPEEFAGYLRSEIGHTGNTISYAHYFLRDKDELNHWWKGGITVGIAKKNPLEYATQAVNKGLWGKSLLESMENHSRMVEIRVTGDDLPMPTNRVDLDPSHVDEYGLPVARITRNYGEHEKKMFNLIHVKMQRIADKYKELGLDLGRGYTAKSGVFDLIGDHQMGTCRMGNDPETSVTNRFGQMHDIKNIILADTSTFTTGLGVNPMITTVANALRIGTWIVDEGIID